MRDSFVFYGSFYEALSEIDDDSVRLAVYDAVAGYALTGVVPELSGTASAMFKLIQPVIDANNKRRDDGCKGGRPKTKPMVTENEQKSKPMVTENEQKSKPNKDEDMDEEGDIYNPVIAHLNERAGTHYSTQTRATRRLIDARVREGYALKDFTAVIDKKADEWNGTDMARFLRPETLFGTKFEGYLNQPKSRTSPKLQAFNERQYAPDELERLVADPLAMLMDDG